MKNLKIKVSLSTNVLSETTKEEMWEVYRQYYHYSKAYFMERIHRNNFFSIYRYQGQIVGFTGLRIKRTKVNKKSCVLIYFGQTVIDSRFRGQGLIPRTAILLGKKYWKDFLLARVYVWADALTYKAYLVFAKNLEEYYPSYKGQTPPKFQQLIDLVGTTYYGENYQTQTGTVHKDTVFVNDHSTIIQTRYERDLDVLFYAALNPNYINGHGLITMAQLHSNNCIRILARHLKKVVLKKITARKQVRPRFA